MIRLSLLLMINVLLVTPLQAQTPYVQWGETVVVHGSTQHLIRPRIALNSEGQAVVLWGQASPAANYVAVSDGDGFSMPHMIHPATVHPAVADWQGSDIVAAGDMLYAVLKNTPESTGGVYLVSSSDGGHTWTDTLRVDDIPGYKSRFSSVAVNSAGEALVQYMRIDMQETDHRYMVSRIVNGVVQPPVDVSSPFTAGEDCDCCPGQVIAEGDDVVALFRDATSNLRVIWGARSSDGGETFIEGHQLDPTNWTLNACPATGPDGFIDGDSLHYTWMSGAAAGSKVYVGAAALSDLSDGIVSQAQPGQPQTVTQNHPRIAGSGDTLGVVWQSSVAGQLEILAAFKTPGLNGMTDPDTVNVNLTGQQRSPDIAYADGVFHIVWADYQANSITYRTATLNGTIGIPESTTMNELSVWPVPASDRIQVDLPGTAVGGMVEVYDAHGRIVRSMNAASSLLLEGIATGLYTLILKDRNGDPVGRAQFNVAR